MRGSRLSKSSYAHSLITPQIRADTPLGSELLEGDLAEDGTQGRKTILTPYPEALYVKSLERYWNQPTNREMLDAWGAETGLESIA